MFIRAYLRASTQEQDARRAEELLDEFVLQHNHKIAAKYVENASGATSDRPELNRLLKDAQDGDVLLVEAIDRLSRLPKKGWDTLRSQIASKGLRVVAVDLPTSHTALTKDLDDEFTCRMLDAVNSMMLDMVAAIARKDYETRRERQAQGIKKAKAAGVYTGRPRDTEKRQKIAELLKAGFSIRKTASIAGSSPTTVVAVSREINSQ